MGWWNSDGYGIINRGNGFIDNSGVLTPLTNSQFPDTDFHIGINDGGWAVGADGGDGGDGFLNYISSNTYQLIYGPANAVSAALVGINDDNQAVGYYVVPNSNGSGTYDVEMFYQYGVYPFPFDANCPAETTTVGFTSLFGINGHGQIVGFYSSADNTQVHSFVYSNGICTLIDAVGALPGGTVARGINNNGQIVGYYTDTSANENVHGFMLDGSVYYSFDPPNSTFGWTEPIGINDAAQIVGTAIVGNGCPPYFCSYVGFEYSLAPAP